MIADVAKAHAVKPREITVLDRIGGGDGFVGRLLYAILKAWEPEKWIQFGWAKWGSGHGIPYGLRTACG